MRHGSAPSDERVRAAVEQAFRRPSKVSASAGNVFRFDDEASPWHMRCSIEAPDRPGLLADLTASFASVGVSVHSARIRTDNGYAFDEFALSSRDGSKLTDADRNALVKQLAQIFPTRKALTRWKQSSPHYETRAFYVGGWKVASMVRRPIHTFPTHIIRETGLSGMVECRAWSLAMALVACPG